MREAIGGTWIFQVVIGFILLFTGFICLAVNRSKAFATKDQIIQVIQSYNGISTQYQLEGYNEGRIDAFYDIHDYIKSTSYRNTGVKPDPEKVGEEVYEYYCYDRNAKYTSKDNNATFCIAPISVKNDGCNVSMDCNELPSMTYYKIVVFYQLDIPVFHDLFNFTVKGDTKTMLGEAR